MADVVAPEEEVQEESKPTFYAIHSLVRRQKTKLTRTTAPKRHRFMLHIGGGDIKVRRGKHRPTVIREGLFMRHLRDIKEKADAGMIEVRTPTGQLVDLDTFEVAPLPPPKPTPDPPVDTAADDKPAGEPQRVYPEGRAIDEEPETPALADATLPEGEEPPPEEETLQSEEAGSSDTEEEELLVVDGHEVNYDEDAPEEGGEES